MEIRVKYGRQKRQCIMYFSEYWKNRSKYSRWKDGLESKQNLKILKCLCQWKKAKQQWNQPLNPTERLWINCTLSEVLYQGPSMPLSLYISLEARLYRQCSGTGRRGSEVMHWWEGSEGYSARYAKKSWFCDSNFHFSILAEIIPHQKRDIHLRWLGNDNTT